MTDTLNLAGPIRSALIGHAGIAAALSQWNNEPAVFTKRPAPPGSGYVMAMVSPDVNLGDMDGLTSRRPWVQRDVAFYGLQSNDYRAVEELAYAARRLFHSNRFSIVVPGHHVVDVRCRGPMEAPADDVALVGRMVALTIRLVELP